MRTILTILALLVSVLTGTGMQAAQATPEPYGGCKEAYRHPHSARAQDCREAGWTDAARMA